MKTAKNSRANQAAIKRQKPHRPPLFILKRKKQDHCRDRDVRTRKRAAPRAAVRREEMDEIIEEMAFEWATGCGLQIERTIDGEQDVDEIVDSVGCGHEKEKLVKLHPLAREVPVSSDDRYPEKVRKVAEVQKLREHDKRKLLTEKEAGLISEKCSFDSLKPSGQAPVSEGFGEEFDFLVEHRKKQNRIPIVNEPYRAGHPRSPDVAEGGRRCAPYQVQCGDQPKGGEGLAKDEDERPGCDQV